MDAVVEVTGKVLTAVVVNVLVELVVEVVVEARVIVVVDGITGKGGNTVAVQVLAVELKPEPV